MKTTQLKVYAIANGIKARCRKASREFIKLGYMPIDGNKEEMRELAKSIVIRTMKAVTKCTLHFDYVEVENDGYAIETWQMFDPRHTREILINT